jgi:hypothetical protein
MLVRDGANLSMHQSLVLRNSMTGVEISSAQGALENCIVGGNLHNGIGLLSSDGAPTSATLQRCNLLYNNLNGVDAFFGTRVELHECVIVGHTTGILHHTHHEAANDSKRLESLRASNYLDGNIRDVVLQIAPSAAELCAETLRKGQCTLVFCGPHYLEQDFYHCTTCGLVNNLGMCASCADHHRADGHETYFVSHQKCFCDCPAEMGADCPFYQKPPRKQ